MKHKISVLLWLAVSAHCLIQGLCGAEGEIDPPGTATTYDLPRPTARYVSRLVSETVIPEQVGTPPGLQGFDNNSTEYYSGYKWHLKRISYHHGTTRTSTVTANLNIATGVWTIKKDSGHFLRNTFSVGWTSYWNSGPNEPWEYSSTVFPHIWTHHEFFGMTGQRNAYIKEASYYQGLISDTQAKWTVPWFYYEGWDRREGIDELTVTLSERTVAPVTPTHTVRSVGDWLDEPPAAIRDGNSEVSSEYYILASHELKGVTASWREVSAYTDSGHEVAVPKYWKIDSQKSPTFQLKMEGNGWAYGDEIKLLIARLAVDANRDGEITLSSEATSDTTSSVFPFRFWLNDDDDVDDNDPDDSENAPVVKVDWDDDKIDGIRDLEDLARLKIYLGGLQDAVRQGQIRVGLKWKGAWGSTGAAGIKVWRNLSANGGTEYLTDVNVAQQHLALSRPGTIQGALSYIIPTQYWTDVGLSESQPYGNLLFEGTSAGKDQLVITLHKADGTEIGEGPGVWFDLTNIKSMYERVKATADGAENFPFPYNHVGSDPVPAPAMGWTPDPNGFSFEPAPGESVTYIVSVHGWNQTYERSTMYAETMFKRMWHRGYKGRFVRFRWPTFTGLTTYNDSEYRAWKCGVSLKQYLDTLPSTYTVNLVAHSMGNIVAGSALEKGASVANYALLNAAVPAICYDTSGTVVQTSWGYETPNDDPDSATAGLSYQGRLANVSGNLVNFFLPSDSALAAWEINNDSPSGGRYPVAGAKPHQWPEGSINAGYRYQRTATAGQKLRVVRVAGERILNSADEAMGFAVQAPSLTVGADGRTRGSIDDWVDMTAYGFDSVHSAEFLFTIHQTRDFYGALLLKLGVTVQP